ncbi:hypothetical protein IC582_019168 [Cucumis melo]
MPILMDHQNRLQRPSGLSSLMRPLCYSMACISSGSGLLEEAICGEGTYLGFSSWDGLGNMVPAEAMRLFVKILEEEESGWYSRVSNFVLEPEPILDVQINVSIWNPYHISYYAILLSYCHRSIRKLLIKLIWILHCSLFLAS